LPEDPVFRETIYAQEDCAYHQWLLAFFNVLWLEPETVVYQRHPGNRFDLQLAKFQESAAANQTVLSTPEQRYRVEIAELVRQRKIALHTKLQQLQERDRLFEQGNQCFGQDQFSQALEFYRQVLRLDPDFLAARYNLGVSYLGLEQWPDANHWLQQVVETDPSHAAAHNNLGLVAFLQGQMQPALNHFRQAIAVAPDFADAHLNLALALFHTGDFLGGWQEYEWRLKTLQVPPFACVHPRWDGTPMPGKTILIHTEQGSGDAIQFARYLPLVKQQFGRVLLVCIPELADLLGTAAGVDQVLPPGDIALDQFQTYTSLMSLPLLFKTTAETIPQQMPYLQIPAHATVSLPAAQGASPRLKVGLVWAGSPTHRDDRRRSCKLTDYLPLLNVSDVHFYSLQKRVSAAEQAQLRDFGITDLSEQLNTFADTAAAIAQLDVVISVDTSVVHLAGALGKPVWALLCFCPDWRWGLQGNTTPWYPTMRLFRQPAAHQWQTVLHEVTEALKRYKPTGKRQKV
jgi:Tetratricopeptide repeat/TPR repeat/Glycosyltransferase family 9 (heptosyltransferase)